MNEYLKAQSKTNDSIRSNIFSTDELNRFSKADYRWADDRTRHFRHRAVKKGEIYQFEFGKNYQPEMSYEHRGLVIGVKQKLLYVLPIFSYCPSKHLDVFHPSDFPTSKSDMYLLKSDEFPFIRHDSVLKLNDLRTVSINRILYQHEGAIVPSSNTYKNIEQLVLQKYFPEVRYNYNLTKQKLAEANSDIRKKDELLQALTSENKILRSQLHQLNQHFSSTNTP